MTPRQSLDYPARLQQTQVQAREKRIREAFAPLVDVVTDLDESHRRAAVEHVLRTCLPVVVACLIDHSANPLPGRNSPAIRRFSSPRLRSRSAPLPPIIRPRSSPPRITSSPSPPTRLFGPLPPRRR